jgi:hypothetical protein
MSDEENLARCARCGRAIDDDEVVLKIYAADERDFNPNDPSPVFVSYCETCTRKIEEQHERHDQEVEAFRDELDRFDSS